MAAAHIGQGSSVTATVHPIRRGEPSTRAAARIARSSAWALASCSASTALPARASSAPDGDSTAAPTGTSPRAPAARASSSAIAIASAAGLLQWKVHPRVLPPRGRRV